MAEAVKVDLREEQRVADIKVQMSTRAGRRYVWRKLAEAGLFHPCFCPEDEGRRRFGLVMQGEIMDLCPDEYLTMRREAIEDEKAWKASEMAQAGNDGDDGTTSG